MTALAEFFVLDFVPLTTLILAAGLCGTLGVYLAPRHQLMTADALAHLVAPGLVVAFLVTGSQTGLIFGAAVAVMIGGLAINWLKTWAGLHQGASIGIVFTVMFALGIVLMESFDLGNVHLDARHILFGNVQSLIWPAAAHEGAVLEAQTWAQLPEDTWTLLIVLILCLAALWGARRLIDVTGFDPIYATVRGLPTRALNLGILFIAGLVLLATFHAVGVILAIALLACPAAAARRLSSHIHSQSCLGGLIGMLCAALGYGLATIPDYGFDPHTGGVVAVVSGAVMASTVVWRRGA